MSELEHCRLAHEGKLDEFIGKINSNKVENLAKKKDQVKTLPFIVVIKENVNVCFC